MRCISPIINANDEKLDPDNPVKLEFGFIMDGVASVRDLSSKGHAKFKLYPNPIFYPFPELVKYITNQLLTITGKNLNLVCTTNDVRVLIGDSLCNITTLSRNFVECQPPQLSAENEYVIDTLIGKMQQLVYDSIIFCCHFPLSVSSCAFLKKKFCVSSTTLFL